MKGKEGVENNLSYMPLILCMYMHLRYKRAIIQAKRKLI